MSASIKIKNHSVLINLLAIPYHKKLIELVVWCAFRHSNIIFTSGYRDGDRGVHGLKPCRGMDIRSWIFDNPQEIVNDINSYWIYDPKRLKYMCAILHDTGKGEHIHLQAHSRTECLNIARKLND